MTSFKRLVIVRILANVAIGLMLMVWPALPFEWLYETAPEPIWVVRLVGVAMIYLALAHVASAVAPALAMSSNLFVVLGPLVPIALLLWIGLGVPSRVALMLAFYEAVFVLLLCLTFQRGWLRDLATRP